MNRVYQLEFYGLQANLLSLPLRQPAVFRLNNDNHDLSGLTQAIAELNRRGEEVVSVGSSGSSGDGIRPRFLIVTEEIGKATEDPNGLTRVGRVPLDGVVVMGPGPE